MSEDQALFTFQPHDSPLKPKGLVQSHSTGGIKFLQQVDPRASAMMYQPTRGLGDDEGIAVRGRPTSPVKALRDVDENDDDDEEEIEIPMTPVKRSRSPMKKMFGENGWLGRSTSMYEIPSEQQKRSGLKMWSEKIKHRVEGLVRSTPLHEYA